MKLWFLKYKLNLTEDQNPWRQWSGTRTGFVIRTETEEEARELAHQNGENENDEIPTIPEPWKNPNCSICVEIPVEGRPEVILMNYHH